MLQCSAKGSVSEEGRVMASGLVVGVVSGEYGESVTAGSVGVGVGALIETNLSLT